MLYLQGVKLIHVEKPLHNYYTGWAKPILHNIHLHRAACNRSLVLFCIALSEWMLCKIGILHLFCTNLNLAVY